MSSSARRAQCGEATPCQRRPRLVASQRCLVDRIDWFIRESSEQIEKSADHERLRTRAILADPYLCRTPAAASMPPRSSSPSNSQQSSRYHQIALARAAKSARMIDQQPAIVSVGPR